MSQEHPGKDKEVTIIINGQAHPVLREKITYEEVVALAFPGAPTGDGIQFSVQFTRGHSEKPKGTLVEGQDVMVQDGMEFDVTQTTRS